MIPAPRHTPLEMNNEQFRSVGYALIDSIAELITTMGDRPVTTGETPAQLHSLLGAPSVPEEGVAAEVIMRRAVDLLFNHSLFNGHPKFLGYITSSPAPLGMLADLLASAVNPNVGANILSPMATEIEKQTISWLAELIGVSPSYGGILVSGGNMANFTAFLAARKAKGQAYTKQEGLAGTNVQWKVYCSKATHAWVEKAVILFGLGTQSIRWIDQSEDGTMKIEHLEQVIEKDLHSGHHPFIVIGNAGDVSTGVVDDLHAIGSVCKKFKLWFHIDGAYGAPAAVIPDLKDLFLGMENADSIALDPHKWLYSPLEAGCTLVKNPQTLIDTYSSHPVYYNFSDPLSQTHNFYEYGFQNSRGFRALKVWATLQQSGRSGYIKMISDDIALSKMLFHLAEQHSDLEAVTQHLSITTFRYLPTIRSENKEVNETYLNELNQALLNRLQKNGEVFLSNAVVKEKYCLRACIVNFRTSAKDIEEIIAVVVREGRALDNELKNQKSTPETKTDNPNKMNPNKQLWEKGDFTQIAETMRESGAALVSQFGITPGLRVLDLGCGDGTTAIPAAQLGADVVGVDIARNLVDAGNARAKKAGLSNCTFREGDARDLNHLHDHSFDLTLSIFGAMFAPSPLDVAKEMVRVTKPGGRIIMGNWIPGDPTLVAQILKISSAYTPPPPEGFVSPMTWGIEAQVIERFTKAGVPSENISCVNDIFTFKAAISPEEFVNNFKNFYGPTMNAFDAAEKNGKAEALQGELIDLFKAQNQSGNSTSVSIPAKFFRVTVRL